MAKIMPLRIIINKPPHRRCLSARLCQVTCTLQRLWASALILRSKRSASWPWKPTRPSLRIRLIGPFNDSLTLRAITSWSQRCSTKQKTDKAPNTQNSKPPSTTKSFTPIKVLKNGKKRSNSRSSVKKLKKRHKANSKIPKNSRNVSECSKCTMPKWIRFGAATPITVWCANKRS